jgi:RNA polymerase sigma factor (sigma-70 family)
MEPPIDVAECEALVQRTAAGDPAAFDALCKQLWPWLVKFIRSNRSMAGMSREEDHVADVAAHVYAKLKADGFYRLHHFADWRAANADKTLLDWLRIVTKNVIREYVSEHLAAQERNLSANRLLNEFALSGGSGTVRPPYTDSETARQLLEFARVRLEPQQVRVLGRWLEGATFDEIGSELGMSSSQAHRLKDDAVERLRRHFGRAPGFTRT